MWIRPYISLLFLLTFSFYNLIAQEIPEKLLPDSVLLTDKPELTRIDEKGKELSTGKVITDTYKPDPVNTIWLGAVIPGYGQIVNRKYWKLPIVYGGFLGCAYAIGWNASRFLSYKNAYLDITDNDDKTNSFLEIIPPGYTIDSYGGEAAFTGLLKTGMDKARYNRDLSVIVSIAYYGLTLIDAYVDAHLYDFDISPDLSLKLRPTILNNQITSNQLSKSFSYGLSGSIKF
ncbi:MAG: DUF5683 domain-containing protein [Paludibacter sp.]|nr:DUF5683 domain-containing protein [Paludibacter sp.]